MGRTLFNLAPAGIGKTSFRISETVQLGRIPFYIYDKVPWLPYPDTEYSLEHIGYIVGNAKDLMQLLQKLGNKVLRSKLNAVLAARDAYTMDGVMREIEHFFHAPFSIEGKSHLRCIKGRNNWIDQFNHITETVASTLYTTAFSEVAHVWQVLQ